MKRINIYSVKQVKEKAALYDVPSTGITSPESAYLIIEAVLSLSESPVEKFGIFSLNTKNQVVGVHVIHVGSISSSLVDPRAVFQAALLNNAQSIICFHNHPSGSPDESQADISITTRLSSVGQLLGIPVLDHIIVGDDCFTSLKEKGLM